MATKKLSEVGIVTTMNSNDYIIMNTAEGDTVQILRSDFVNAITEIIPLAYINNKGLMSQDDIISRAAAVVNGDANDFPLGVRLANQCINSPAPYCYILTIEYRTSHQNRAQLAIGYNSPLLKTRYRINGIWSTWT